MLKNILKVGKLLSKTEQQSINGGENAPPQREGGGDPETEACYHCGLWVPSDEGYNSNIPCGITPF